MKESVKPSSQNVEQRPNRNSQAEARLRFIHDGRSNSPRAAVAFSGLAAVTWLKSKFENLFARIGIRPRRNPELDKAQVQCAAELAAPKRLRETKTITQPLCDERNYPPSSLSEA
jgi:hypothetical protein